MKSAADKTIEGKHVLVTGGAGFIGSHLVERLLATRCRVTVVDDLSTGSMDNLPTGAGIALIRKPVQELSAKQLESDGIHPEAVVHLAALPSVEGSWRSLCEAHHSTLTTTVRVLEWCRDLGIEKLVYASSAAVYGSTDRVPVTEDFPADPISPYGLQKLTSEHYLRLLAGKKGPAAVALRFFNVYGPRQCPDSPYSGVISIFSAAMKNGKDITIHGDGSQSRDFIHVTDVAEACIRALGVSLPPEERFQAVNIGTGGEASLRDLVAGLREIHPDWRGTLRYSDARAGDIHRSCAGVKKAFDLLGFNATVDLKQGLRRM